MPNHVQGSGLKLLVIEDSEADYRLIERQLQRQGLNAECLRVDTNERLDEALQTSVWDVVLSDYQVPGMQLSSSLRLIHRYCPDTPIILVSGNIGEETAVDLLKQGINDFVLKDRMARLGAAIERSRREMQEQRARRAAENALRRSEERFDLALRGANDGVWDWDMLSGQIYYSPRWKSMLGYEDGELVNNFDTWKRLVHHDDLEPTDALLQAFIKGHLRKFEVEFRMQHKEGHYLHVLSRGFLVRDPQTGQPLRMVGTHVDLSELKAAQARIQHLAQHDSLTDLPNRSLLVDRLTQAIALAERSRHQVGVLFFDLDNFKQVNDTLGHAAGDELLTELAQRLSRLVRAGDTLARLGGDEFVLVLAEIHGIEAILRVVTDLTGALAQPFFIAGQYLQVTTSLGISLYPRDGDDGSTLLKKADNAMYHAKWAGRAGYRFFSPEMDTAAHQRFQTEADLRKALEHGEFVLYYQPQVQTRNGQTRGFEALLRWEHPTRGLLRPNAFLSVAEETGYIVRLGEWVLHHACRQCRDWQLQGLSLSVAVNLSARQFRRVDFVSVVKRVLNETGLSGDRLELELTEHLLVEPTDHTVSVLHDLREMGVRLAVDDFGTGYSSLSYLKSYPINTLKIAQPFIDDVALDPDDRAITEAVVAMAHALRLETIAEGAETLTQLEVLREIGVNWTQGYYFSRPLPAPEVSAYLASI